jgi:hypothetical protein
MFDSLANSPLADRALRDAVALIEVAWPGRVRGYYLVGSYAVGEARPSSDLDLIVLAKGEIEPADRELFAPIRETCKQASAILLDITLESEAKFFRVGGVWFQTASLLVHGDDVRAQIPRKPVERHIRDLMHAVYPLLARVRGNPSVLRHPLGFPDPAGELRGYDARFRDTAPAQRTPTKDLVTNVLGAANALTLLRARQYVGTGRKRDIPEQYRRWIGGEWAELVEDTYERCRVQWDYQVPNQPAVGLPGAERAGRSGMAARAMCPRAGVRESRSGAVQGFFACRIAAPQPAVPAHGGAAARAARLWRCVIYQQIVIGSPLTPRSSPVDLAMRESCRCTL